MAASRRSSTADRQRALLNESPPSRRFSGEVVVEAKRRVGRPPLGEEPRQLIAIRVDAGVLDQFRKEARRRRVGYQTLINDVLARHVRKDVA